jgi:hypothetical protein
MSAANYIITIKERTLVSKRFLWKQTEEAETRTLVHIESDHKPSLRDLAAILEPLETP